MKLSAIAQTLGLTDLTPELVGGEEVDVSLGHVSDLLSDVLGNAPEGSILVTIQVHLNVIAVAVHAGLAAIIFASDREPEPGVRQKALEQGMRLYGSHGSAFDVVGQLYALGLRGRHA